MMIKAWSSSSSIVVTPILRYQSLEMMKLLRGPMQKKHILYRSLTTTVTLDSSAASIEGRVRDRVIPSARGPPSYRFTGLPHTCTIIGAPMTYGQPYVGTDCAPQILREMGLRSMLSVLGWRVEDLPDLDFDQFTTHAAELSSSSSLLGGKRTTIQGRVKNPQIVGKGTELLANLVAEKLKMGRFPLILGGDHSIGIGSLAGVLHTRPNTGIIWVDAHADINTPLISESGNMHGMPVGMLMEGVSPADPVPGFEWLHHTFTTRLSPDSIVYVGLRDVDPAERDLISSLGIKAYTMHEIDRYGIGQVMEMTLDHLLGRNPERPIHLSYDIDAVDPVLAPATGTTVRGGLTFREAHFVAEAVAQTGNLASADVVELNPTLSHDEGAKETAQMGLQIITSLMGKSII